MFKRSAERHVTVDARLIDGKGSLPTFQLRWLGYDAGLGEHSLVRRQPQQVVINMLAYTFLRSHAAINEEKQLLMKCEELASVSSARRYQGHDGRKHTTCFVQ